MRPQASENVPQEPRQVPAGSQSPDPSLPEPHDAVGDEGMEAESSTETPTTSEPPASSYHSWMKSPEHSGLSFSPVNSNLRDLTPSHTLEMGAFRPETAATGNFSEGGPYYACSEEGGAMTFTRSLSGDGTEGGGTAQNPPQKKKVNYFLFLYVVECRI